MSREPAQEHIHPYGSYHKHLLGVTCMPTLTECGAAGGARLESRAQYSILMQVQLPSEARDFSALVNFQCILSYGAHAALVCNHMHQHLHAP